eukprot:scaffold452_cov235-Pinguiococcus_pyrenoidosus.AAC.16
MNEGRTGPNQTTQPCSGAYLRVAAVGWHGAKGPRLAAGGIHGCLRLGRDGRHGLQRLVRPGSLGRLSAEHDAVRTVQYGVGHVGHLRSRRPRVLDHRVEHLRGADHGLPAEVAALDHVLLRHKHLLEGNLDAEVAASHHDTIGRLQNAREVLHALQILNLRDDLDVRIAGLHQHVPNLVHVLRLPHEGRKDHVHVLGRRELEVARILG